LILPRNNLFLSPKKSVIYFLGEEDRIKVLKINALSLKKTAILLTGQVKVNLAYHMDNLLIDTAVDGHVHTRLCHHASGEMEEYVLAAINKGLRKLIFLEHLEIGIDYFESTWLTEKDFNFYHEEGKRLQDKYKGSLEIGLGVEVGYNPKSIEETLHRLNLHTWDRIGISYHFMDTDSEHLNLVSSKQVNINALDKIGVDKVVSRYYKELLDAVEKLPGQVLCHIDAVMRHHPNVVITPEHNTLIDDLLDSVARNNMSLEVNTSGYRIKDEPYPSLEILKKAVKKNIPLVVGSDAHCPEDVGRYFDRLPKLMQKLIF
jgi:histidinol-phosphatase (PHP family)